MTRLKKLLLVLLVSSLTLFGAIGVYGLGTNPYSANLDSSTVSSLDNVVGLIENKGASLSTNGYAGLIAAISDRLLYLNHEIVGLRDNNSSTNPYSANLGSSTSSLDSLINTVKSKGTSISEENYTNLLNAISNRLLYINHEIVAIRDDLGVGTGNNNVGGGSASEVIDMNAIPTDLDLDANGWPKYLNIPSECPAPKQGKKYSFYFGLERAISGSTTPANYPGFKPVGPLPLDPSTELQSGFTTVRNYFRQGGNWFQVPLTDDDIVAAPIYFSNVELATRLLSAPLNSPMFPPQAVRKVSISYCPGEFGTFTPSSNNLTGPTQISPDLTVPDGQIPLKGGCASYASKLDLIISNDEINSTHPMRCLLKPNVRYFINMENQEEWTGNISHEESPCEKSGESARASSKKNGKQVCATQFVNYGSRSFQTTVPPYTGPCLYEPPYPINYDSATCLGARGYPHETSHMNCSDFSWLQTPETWDCYDSLGIKPPQKFTLACVNGRMDWIEGKGKPAWSSYVCEQSRELTYRDGGYDICNEEKEGQVYDIQCDNLTLAYRQNEGYKQCQFDTETQNYRWVYTHTKMSGFGWTTQTRRCDAKETTTPIENKCGFAGETYPIGTVQNIRCTPRPNTIISPSLIEMKKECKVTGTVNGQPGIPSFVSTQGYEWYDMFLLNRSNFGGEGSNSNSNGRGFTLIQGFGNSSNSYNCEFTYETP